MQVMAALHPTQLVASEAMAASYRGTLLHTQTDPAVGLLCEP